MKGFPVIRHWLRSLRQGKFSVYSTRSLQKRRTQSRGMSAEMLEGRQLLAANPVVQPKLNPNSGLDTQLQYLLAAPNDEVVRSNLQFDAAGRVMVRVAAYNLDMARTALRPLGFVEVGSDAAFSILEGYLAVTQLTRASNLTAQGVGGLTALPKPFTKSGLVQTQGDSVVRADRVRNFIPTGLPSGYNGSGVKIGVISDSYNSLGGASSDVSNGDLPNGIQVIRDRVGGTDEGRAMLQIIYDVAPGATLAFHTAGGSETELATAIRALAAAGCNIIVDDIGFATQAFFQDGPASVAIDEVAAQGVSYFSASGNYGDRSYQNTTIATAVDTVGTTTGNFIDFDTTALGVDTRQRIVIPNNGRIDLVLQWDDAFTSPGSVDSNVDMFLVNSANGQIVASSINDNSRTGMPLEQITFTNTLGAGVTQFDLMVLVRIPGTTPVTRIKWVDLGGDFSVALGDTLYNSGTVVGHPAALGSIAVGAVPYYNHLQAETFSSSGPIERLFSNAGGQLLSVETRIGARIAAPDNVNTSFFGADIALDLDTRPNFSGTSAAAPHAAAVAALLKQANPTMTPTQLRDRLQLTAIDVGATGFDSVTGSGLVDTWRAIYGTTPSKVSDPQTLNYAEGFEPPTVALPLTWEVSTNGNGRVRISNANGPDNGTQHLLLDAQDSGSQGSLAAATLSVNMSRVVNGVLRFRQREYAEADNPMPSKFSGSSNSDGVAVSFDDGATWDRLISLTAANSSDFYRTFQYDLNALATSLNRQLTANMKFRFQSFSVNPVEGRGGSPATGTGGFAFDEIQITGTVFNNPPTLTTFNRLGTATENVPFTIPGSVLFSNGNEADPDRDPLTYMITSVASGSVTINGVAWTGTERISAGDTIVWTPALDVNGNVTAFQVVVSDGDKQSSPPVDVVVTVIPADSPPRFTKLGVLPNGQRGQAYSIPYDLFIQYYEATDIDTAGPIRYAINSVLSGRLTLNNVPVSNGTPFNPGDTLVWTPPSRVVSIADAFTVDAIGPGDILAPVPATVKVSLPNTAPTMTIVGAIGGAIEDRPLTFDYDELMTKARAVDPDGDQVFFVVTAVAPGARLLVNNQPVVPNVTQISRDDILTWIPATDTNLTQVGFYLKATDGDLSTPAPLPVLFDVQPVYDPPALLPPSAVVDVINGVARDFSFEELRTITAANAIDGVLSFRVVQVLSGVLTKNGVPVQPGVTTLGPGEVLRWSPPAGQFGLTQAFSLQSSDGQTFSSAVNITADITQTRFYRAYNANAQYHFLTSNWLEFLATLSRGLSDESTGQSGFALGTRKLDTNTELFRLRNPSTGRHYYTQNSIERNGLINIGWTYEKVEGYIFNTQVPGTVPVYRLYNQLSGTHLFTEASSVRDAILNSFPGAWSEHSLLGYAYPISGGAVSAFSPPSTGQRSVSAPVANASVSSISAPVLAASVTDTTHVAGLVASSATSSPVVAASTPASDPVVRSSPISNSSSDAVDNFWETVGRSLSDDEGDSLLAE